MSFTPRPPSERRVSAVKEGGSCEAQRELCVAEPSKTDRRKRRIGPMGDSLVES
jgi:hypothetical protein